MIESFNFIVNNIRNVAKQISVSSGQLLSASKESSLSAEEIESSSVQLSNMADKLLGTIYKFKIQ